MLLEYFYGNEVEQFSFYRIPKLLITSEYFKKLSDSAKILYSLMLDRMSLSLKNNWVDENNKAYIYFTTEDVMEMMCCGTQKATKLFAELDTVKGIGLIERKKQGQGKPAKIYVKKFFTDDMSAPKTDRGLKNIDNKKQVFTKEEVCLDSVENISLLTEPAESLAVEDLKARANQESESKEKIKHNSTLISYEEYNQNMKLVKEKIDYELMTIENDRELVDEVVEIMAEVLTVPRDYYIEGFKYPYTVVKNRFENITYEKISAFLMRFKRYANKIYNIKNYIITSLFNAHSTTSLWFLNSVNNCI